MGTEQKIDPFTLAAIMGHAMRRYQQAMRAELG